MRERLNYEMPSLTYEMIMANFASAKTHADFYGWLSGAEENEALAVKKLLKKEQIEALKNEAIESGVEYKGKVFQSAEKDRNLLTSTTSLFSITNQVPEGFKWIAKDNEAVDFTLQDLIALGGKMAENVNLNTMKARALKDKVEKARNLNELESIQWT